MAIAQSEEEEGAWEAGGRGADSDVNGCDHVPGSARRGW